MARKKQKTEGQPEQISNVKDVTENTLEAENDVFADIMNVLLFGGRQEVTENELEQAQEVFQMMSALTGDCRFEETYQQTQEKGAKVGNMCEVLDKIENRGVQRGLQQGREQKTIAQIKKKILKNKSISEIADALEETEEDIRRIYDVIQEMGLDTPDEDIYDRLHT